MWADLRALEENAALMSRIAKSMRDRGNERVAARFDQQADSSLARAETLRRLILDREALTIAEPEKRQEVTAD